MKENMGWDKDRFFAGNICHTHIINHNYSDQVNCMSFKHDLLMWLLQVVNSFIQCMYDIKYNVNNALNRVKTTSYGVIQFTSLPDRKYISNARKRKIIFGEISSIQKDWFMYILRLYQMQPDCESIVCFCNPRWWSSTYSIPKISPWHGMAPHLYTDKEYCTVGPLGLGESLWVCERRDSSLCRHPPRTCLDVHSCTWRSARVQNYCRWELRIQNYCPLSSERGRRAWRSRDACCWWERRGRQP